jgi:glycosyltransferase involved in cell wall biosynthesis
MELGGMSKWHPFIMMVQVAEDYAYRHADVVVSMLPKVREYMESRGMAPHKLHIVPNGIDPAEWQADAPDLPGTAREKLANMKDRKMSIIGYAGAHGLANSLDTLIDAAKLMKGENVSFVFVGDGPDKATLRKRAQAEKLHNIVFLDPVNKKQIPALLKWFDVAYIGLQRQSLFRFGISPNKLMDYMMAARPVLMAIDAGNDPVGESGCGLTVKPEDPAAVVQGIRSLLGLNEDELNAMGQRGRAFVLENHAYPILAQRFLDACKQSRGIT